MMFVKLHLLREYVKKIKQYLLRRHYIIGVCEHNDIVYSSVKRAKEINWIKYSGYKKNWIADPFLLKSNKDVIVFFAEEWVDKDKKGRLVKITVDREKYKIIRKSIILELDTHLSFPIIYRDGKDIYVYPENSESGSLYIYKYNEVNDKLENPIEIIKAPLLDTVIKKIDDIYYAFGVIRKTGLLCDTKILNIYKSHSLLGNYEHFQTIENSLCQERGAGDIINVNKMLIRPIQDCEGDYGKNVIFNRLEFDGSKFKEIKIGTLYPNKKNPEGLHTYNAQDVVAIIDGCAYSCGNIFTIIKKIKKFIYG